MAFGFKLRNPFSTATPHDGENDTAGALGWGSALSIRYAKRPLPPVDNNGSNAYQTYLSPIYTPIGGGIPNQRDIGTTAPAVVTQGVLVAQVGSPGILSGAFGSGPLTNVSTDQSVVVMPVTGMNDFNIPSA